MRISPEAASFLDCFTTEFLPDHSHLAISYSKTTPTNDDIRQIGLCYKHLQQALQKIAAKIGRRVDSKYLPDETGLELQDIEKITQNNPAITSIEKQTDERHKLQLRTAFDLSDPDLKSILLELSAEQINKHLGLDPEFKLSTFITAKQIRKERLDADDISLKDKSALQARLETNFTYPVNTGELELLSKRMNILASKVSSPSLHR